MGPLCVTTPCSKKYGLCGSGQDHVYCEKLRTEALANFCPAAPDPRRTTVVSEPGRPGPQTPNAKPPGILCCSLAAAGPLAPGTIQVLSEVAPKVKSRSHCFSSLLFRRIPLVVGCWNPGFCVSGSQSMMPEEFHHGRFLSWLALEKRSREKARRNRRFNIIQRASHRLVGAF